MLEKTYGLDFGTTNSAIAVRDKKEVKMIPLEANHKETMRTLIFFPIDEKEIYIGDQAIAEYVNCGMQGRFIQSIKTSLPTRMYDGTMIDRYYKIEELVGLILKEIKRRADEYTREDIRRVIIGRPALFGEDKSHEDTAIQRLTAAAKIAGFEEIHFQFEPIAAALTYEQVLTKPKLVLVGDFGGGTSDFTLIRLDPSHKDLTDRRTDILGTSGLRVAGDKLNSEIMLQRLLKYFGKDVNFVVMTKPTVMPISILHNLAEWHHIAFLKNNHVREFVKRVLVSADQKQPIRNLRTLIEDDLGFSLFQEIEITKIALSQESQGTLEFHEHGISISELIQVSEFEQIILKQLNAIRDCITDLLQKTHTLPEQVDLVFLTGGTSCVPSIQQVLSDLFGQAKLRTGETFTSVAYGLALSSHLF